MAFKDSWQRALVYFGLAEERHPTDEYDDDVPSSREPEAELQDRYHERPNVRRLRRRRDEFDDIFADDDDDEPAGRPTGRLRTVNGGGTGGGRSGDVRVHLVHPSSFNEAQQIADKFKQSVPV